MKQPDRFKLHVGPYLPPPNERAGDRIFCEIRGTVTVGGFLDGPIPWPFVKKMGGRSPVLCGALVRAVRRETATAVAHHFGVSKQTVRNWRRLLGVGRVTEGGRALARGIALARTDDRIERSRTPDAGRAGEGRGREAG